MQYFEPNFLNEALVVLDRFGPRAKALAGGTRLGPALRDDRGDVIALVNLKRIASLAAMAVHDDRVTIGALVTAAELARSPAIAASAPLLTAAAASMGSQQLRALASIGGNVCSGDPASDLTVALLASDATCVLGSLDRGERRVPLRDLLIPNALNCAPGDLLVALEVPVSGARSAYRKMMTRRGFEMALVAAAVALEIDDGRVSAARIALAGAGPTCLRATRAERLALGSSPAGSVEEWAEQVGLEAAAHDAAPASDERASADYRRQLVSVLSARALIAALEGAR